MSGPTSRTSSPGRRVTTLGSAHCNLCWGIPRKDSAMDFAARFDKGLTYQAFLDRYGTDDHRRRWQAMYDQVALTEAQKDLVGSWVRRMNVIVVAGTWCGDCVN